MLGAAATDALDVGFAVGEEVAFVTDVPVEAEEEEPEDFLTICPFTMSPSGQTL